MARDGWLEQHTRIPFVGIIAIVFIVAFVAIFLRNGLDKVLPEPVVEVRSANDVQQNIRGSASYLGQREVQLLYKERLQGLLTSRGHSTNFLIDVPARMLVLARGGVYEEILLSPTDDGLGLSADFEYAGMPTSIVIYPAERVLTWLPAGQFPVDVSLTDIVSYEGYFLYAGSQYLFKYLPAGSYATIGTGSEEDEVPLTVSGDDLVGTWRDASGSSHPVAVEMVELQAVIGDLW